MSDQDHAGKGKTNLPETGNRQYLKDYVNQHPDNKMAWYLLGKEYLRRGEQGKANYCFEQSGEIYGAFEKPDAHSFDFIKNKEGWNSALLDMVEAKETPALSYPRKRRSAILRSVRISVVLIWGLFLLLFTPSEKLRKPAQQVSLELPPIHTQAPLSPTLPPSETTPVSPLINVYFIQSDDGADRLDKIVRDMLLTDAQKVRRAVVAKAAASSVKGWSDWSKPPQMLLSADRDASGGRLTLSYHDRSSCSCEPADDSASRRDTAAWKPQQEQLLALLSALAAYKAETGRYPAQAEQLDANYPDNYMSGRTPLMERLFQPLTAYLQARDSADTGRLQQPVPQRQKGDEGRPSTALLPGVTDGFNLSPQLNPWQQPLQIIIDKTHHRLAVASGRMLLRNYPVGLGGDRTPTGDFAITEKVVNPNGRSDGDFGSRGMTLSNTRYAIHGTNKPDSIGKDESLGCIRMGKADIEELFDLVPKGTKVSILSDGLPEEPIRADKPFSLPHTAKQTNPGKRYNWLD